MAKIVLVDDHVLLRNGLAGLIVNLGHTVIFEADNGKDFIARLEKSNLPDIVLLDINMPVMDGYETASWLKEQYPEIKVLGLSMYDNENAIIKMLKNGAKGYILKDSNPIVLQTALDDLETKGFYYSDLVSGKLVHAISNQGNKDQQHLFQLNDRERNFLTLSCSDLTYKEIADKMCVSPRTIDGYRDNLFEKLQIKSRVGLAIYAIKTGLVEL